MIYVQSFRDDPQGLTRDLKRRGFEPPVAQVVELDTRRRARVTGTETLTGRGHRGDRIEALDGEVRRTEVELQQALQWIPNRPAPETPDGQDETDNVVVRQAGETPIFGFESRPPRELGPGLGT